LEEIIVKLLPDRTLGSFSAFRIFVRPLWLNEKMLLLNVQQKLKKFLFLNFPVCYSTGLANA
jgi:hypothetical protein